MRVLKYVALAAFIVFLMLTFRHWLFFIAALLALIAFILLKK